MYILFYIKYTQCIIAMRTNFYLGWDLWDLMCAPSAPCHSNTQEHQLLQSSIKPHLSSFFILPSLTITLIKFSCLFHLWRFLSIFSECGKIDSTFIQQSIWTKHHPSSWKGSVQTTWQNRSLPIGTNLLPSMS